jgi:hypothetical protein
MISFNDVTPEAQQKLEVNGGRVFHSTNPDVRAIVKFPPFTLVQHQPDCDKYLVPGDNGNLYAMADDNILCYTPGPQVLDLGDKNLYA